MSTSADTESAALASASDAYDAIGTGLFLKHLRREQQRVNVKVRMSYDLVMHIVTYLEEKEERLLNNDCPFTFLAGESSDDGDEADGSEPDREAAILARDFDMWEGLLYRVPDHASGGRYREVLADTEIYDAVAFEHDSLRNASVEKTARKVLREYYGVVYADVVWIVRYRHLFYSPPPKPSPKQKEWTSTLVIRTRKCKDAVSSHRCDDC